MGAAFGGLPVFSSVHQIGGSRLSDCFDVNVLTCGYVQAKKLN